MSRLREMRKKARLTQVQLAKSVGNNQPAVSKLEIHGIRYIATAKKYAAVLNCRPIDLLEI